MAEASGRPTLAATARHAAAVVEMTGHLGGEIAALVQEVHGASTPTTRLGVDLIGRGVYGGLRLGFSGLRHVAARSGRIAGRHRPEPDTMLDLQSVLNGAFGHLYDEVASGFALPTTIERSALSTTGASRWIVFVHGLCMNERGWRGPEHDRFVAWARESFDADVGYVRYNSGVRISTSGARLAERLEQVCEEPDAWSAQDANGRVASGPDEIVLVGHSMGGLVARSALHQAIEAGFAWPRRVTRLACLGAPHKGASLERIGNHANRLLRGLPWTRPFMRLGNLRSDGIRDLRFGHLVEDDWRDRHADDPRRAHSTVELAGHVDHLHVAGVRSEHGRDDPLGDWLVPVESALAHDLHPEERVRRELITGLGHIGLLGDARVYDVLRRWLDGGGRS